MKHNNHKSNFVGSDVAAVDLVIAQKYLDACADREDSWNVDSEQYEKPFHVELFQATLTEKEAETGFAKCLILFGAHWWNDTIDICTSIGATLRPLIEKYNKLL